MIVLLILLFIHFLLQLLATFIALGLNADYQYKKWSKKNEY